jgi:hypothetical protein
VKSPSRPSVTPIVTSVKAKTTTTVSTKPKSP